MTFFTLQSVSAFAKTQPLDSNSDVTNKQTMCHLWECKWLKTPTAQPVHFPANSEDAAWHGRVNMLNFQL